MSQNERWADQLDHISETGPRTDRRQVRQSVRLDLDALRLAPDRQDLHDLVQIVGQQADDEQTIEQIDGDAVR